MVLEGVLSWARSQPTKRPIDKKKSALASVLELLGPRWFVMREARDTKLSLLNPRWAMSYLRGPMTGRELRRLRETRG